MIKHHCLEIAFLVVKRTIIKCILLDFLIFPFPWILSCLGGQEVNTQ